MRLVSWQQLPDEMRNDSVRPYYDLLRGKRGSLFFKRVFDIVASFLMSVMLSPVLIVLSIWIKADSKGPVMFRQTRVTQYQKDFRVFKFRTMVVNAESIGAQVTGDRDPRITRVGNKLRNFRLDELPQLFNVFLGDMSFVGTRPEVPRYVSAYSKEMLATLLLPAGVTSKASIEFKDEAELLKDAEDVDKAYIEKVLPEKMKYNLDSITHFSFWDDIRTMFQTVKAVLH